MESPSRKALVLVEETWQVESLRSLPDLSRTVECDCPFSALVAEADLFFLHYNGTPMLEALTTDRPIIVLAEEESTWILPSALALLEKRVVYTRSPEEYFRRIEDALSVPGTLSPCASDEFLHAHGTHENDGKSARRAAAALAPSSPDRRVETDVSRQSVRLVAHDQN